jgi:DNA-binding Lrp family transcriptional regulator
MNVLKSLNTDDRDIALLGAIEDGLPLVPNPFAVVGKQLNLSEDEVISRLHSMIERGIIRRFGLVLHHRPLGYRANAMVVWDVPDGMVDEVAASVSAHDFVTLCYCRTRHAPFWPYNLYCMIHGQDRQVVESQIVQLKEAAGLGGLATKTLFSKKRFKQTGARFSCAPDNFENFRTSGNE